MTNVQLTGGKAHCEIMRYIDAMDLCLNIFKKIPISHMACPIKLFEYLARRKPVISTRLNEVQRIFGDRLLYADTIDELVKSITTVMNCRNEIEENISRNYELTRTMYTWDNIVRNLLNEIRRINVP